MNNNKKAAYVAPSIEIIEIENEGVIATSGGSTNNTLPGFGEGTLNSGSNSRTKSYGTASSSDLEDMINDILTIEN